MKTPVTRIEHHLAIGILLFQGAATMAQVISDPFEEGGDEVYTGFGAFNWVSAVDFGFANHAGSEAFLSNYTGTPIPDIGMIKPLGGSIANTIYRVSFYYSRYSSPSAVPFSDYNYLYIGSANGVMLWDTVPTPVVDGLWLKWSGTFTPDIADIGQPFTFGFNLTLNSGVSLAMDGPVQIQDLATGLPPAAGSPSALQVLSEPGSPYVIVRGDGTMTDLVVHDVQGRSIPVVVEPMQDGWRLAVTHLPAGHLIVRCARADGAVLVGRFVIV